jgi:mycofactocin precursor
MSTDPRTETRDETVAGAGVAVEEQTLSAQDGMVDDLVEDVSIDGMCGVY